MVHRREDKRRMGNREAGLPVAYYLPVLRYLAGYLLGEYVYAAWFLAG